MTVLIVDTCPDTETLLADPAVGGAGLRVERAADGAEAIMRLEQGDVVDVILLSPTLEDPVRVAQRLHSLDRDGSVVILATADREAELRHAIAVAPFLGDGVIAAASPGELELAIVLGEAAGRSRARREEAVEHKKRRETPPPLSARYLGTLLDSAPIGIVTIDAEGGVIGWNRRAGEMLGVPEVEALGMAFTELWPADERERLDALVASLDSTGLGSAGETFEREGSAFDLTGARFTIRSGETGAIIVLQDVTQRVAAEHQLRVQKALADAQARTLQESLLPPHLPAIEQIQLAAYFRPAGIGLEVGGDFYDIFEIGGNQWALVIGDVCGKGAEAAAVTALTRYTVRAAAMYETTGAGVLRVLNAALLRQRRDSRFTTLAYCVVDLDSDPRTVRAAAGGHPLPLLLRADGSVVAIGARGPLLGVIADAEFEESEVSVGEGDAIILYTDGLTDAQAPSRQLTERDLASELARCAGASASEITARLEQLALGRSGAGARDDIAVLVAKLGA